MPTIPRSDAERATDVPSGFRRHAHAAIGYSGSWFGLDTPDASPKTSDMVSLAARIHNGESPKGMTRSPRWRRIMQAAIGGSEGTDHMQKEDLSTSPRKHQNPRRDKHFGGSARCVQTRMTGRGAGSNSSCPGGPKIYAFIKCIFGCPLLMEREELGRTDYGQACGMSAPMS